MLLGVNALWPHLPRERFKVLSPGQTTMPHINPKYFCPAISIQTFSYVLSVCLSHFYLASYACFTLCILYFLIRVFISLKLSADDFFFSVSHHHVLNFFSSTSSFQLSLYLPYFLMFLLLFYIPFYSSDLFIFSLFFSLLRILFVIVNERQCSQT